MSAPMSGTRQRPAARLVTGLAFWIGLALSAAAQAPPSSPWKKAPVKSKLGSGITWIYQQDAISPTTIVGLLIGGGKSAVPSGLDGLAALSTRILLEIPDEGKVQDLMAQATRLSYVCLEDCSIVLIECLTEHLEEALRVAAKIIQDPLISGLRVGRGKDLMKAYAKMDDDDAVAAGRNAVLGAFYGGHGYGSLLHGTEASIKAIDRKDVVGFVKRLMVRPNVFFCVQTDLGEAAVRPLIEKAFNAIPEGAAPVLERQDPVLPADRNMAIERDTKQTYVGQAYLLPRGGLSDMAKGILLETLLGYAPGSRLWALRAEDRLAYDVDTDLTWTKSAGILIAFLKTDRKRAPEAAAGLDRTLEILGTNGVSDQEASASRVLVRSRLLQSTEAKAPRLRLLGLYEILGLGPGAVADLLAAVESVTVEEINAFLRGTLDPARALRIKVGPKAAPDRPGGR